MGSVTKPVWSVATMCMSWANIHTMNVLTRYGQSKKFRIYFSRILIMMTKLSQSYNTLSMLFEGRVSFVGSMVRENIKGFSRGSIPDLHKNWLHGCIPLQVMEKTISRSVKGSFSLSKGPLLVSETETFEFLEGMVGKYISFLPQGYFKKFCKPLN